MPETLELNEDLVKYLARTTPKERTAIYAELGRQEWDRCKADVMYWLDAKRHYVPYVYTRDPKELYECNLCKDGLGRTFDTKHTHLEVYHSMDTSEMGQEELDSRFNAMPTVRPFTIFPYTEPLTRQWLRQKIMFIEKSRDMVTTWWTVAMYTWDTLFHQNRENIFQSDDSTKTLDLVERAFFIWDNQPAFLKEVHPATITSGQTRSGILRVPSLVSTILGFPQGPDQIRQYHPSGVFVDEAAFQVEAEAAFAAVKPAIGAGGRYTAVSSANPGWFMQACKDQEL